MEPIKSSYFADKIIAEITLLTTDYNEAIKNDKEFSGAKSIHDKIKELTEELSILLADNKN